MPEEMRFLLDKYPRDEWNAHPEFHEKTRHWLGAYQMFRRVSERVRLDTEAVLNKDIALRDYFGRPSYFGGNLVANLHGHHVGKITATFQSCLLPTHVSMRDLICWNRTMPI